MRLGEPDAREVVSIISRANDGYRMPCLVMTAAACQFGKPLSSAIFISGSGKSDDLPMTSIVVIRLFHSEPRGPQQSLDVGRVRASAQPLDAAL